MALDKKMLEKLLNNPGMFDPRDTDVEEENMDDAEAMKISSGDSDEEPDSEYELPEDIQDQVEDLKQINTAPAIAKESAASSMMKMEEPKFGGVDPEIMKQLRKLKAGQPLAEDADVEQETIDDPSADPAMRKAAIQKIKQKYLGK